MAIYGTSLLSLCLLVGLLVGQLIGFVIGVDANVGGVGIAMILLILASGWLQSKGLMIKPTQSGVLFWSSIYIPIVVAMAASQDVKAALSGGTVAIIAGILVVMVSFAMVPMVSRLGHAEFVEASVDEDASEGDDR